LLNEITVEALPADLPSEFTVDVSGLTGVGQGITVGQLDFERSKVEIVDADDDELVIKIENAQMAEEPEEEVVTEEEALAKVEATEELTEEELKAREEIEKTEKAELEKEKKEK
jgi:large subunit ribosomal protein L25